MKRITVSFPFLLVLVSIWLVAAYSAPLRDAMTDYGVSSGGQLKILLFAACFYATAMAVSRLLNLFKPFAIALILIAAPASYYMAQYGIMIDADMLINVLETDTAEASDQLSSGFVANLVLMGLLPALTVAFINIPKRSSIRRITQGLAATICFTSLFAGIAYTSYDEFASLFRNHRDVKYRIVPFNVISASVSIVKDRFEEPAKFVPVGTDAVQLSDHEKPRVMVVILGETARADHFALNGYQRQTTPALKELGQSQPLMSYPEAISCGTATAVSVPCMFSFFTADNYDPSARNTGNVLDVMVNAGIKASWIENNSGCKNVCDRIPTLVMDQDKCASKECFDTDMIQPLKQWLADVTDDAIIVLHQMGSHGPAYFARSPKPLKQFLPECESIELTNCSQQEIINAYDNSLLVTDQLISQVIELLDAQTELTTSMMYVSDHGESLGDDGIYLHGIPTWMAPKEQRHVPWLVWPKTDFNAISSGSISHDNFAHTLLGFFDVQTHLYQRQLDLSLMDQSLIAQR